MSRKNLFPLFLCLILSSCGIDKSDNDTELRGRTSSQSNYNSSGSSYHEDDNYKYEHRTGTTGNYEYNYDVEGSDENGNNVTGNIDIRGKYGSGTIVDENGNEKDVDVQWTGYGIMEATDEDGNTYELNPE